MFNAPAFLSAGVLLWGVFSFSGIVINDPAAPFELEGKAQGTSYHISYYADAPLIDQNGVDSLLDAVDSSLSIYKGYSLINRFNLSPRGVKTDRFMRDVVQHSLDLHRETEGLFDITVLPLVEAWGFGAAKPVVKADSASIHAILPCIGSDKILLKGDSLIKTNACTRIDVNGIAQGYSVDLLADYLLSHGVKNFLVELGGEIRVNGKKPDGSLMSIGIESPSPSLEEEPIRKKINLSKGAVTTSGNYRKYIMQQGKRISHLVDPRTGYSFQNELIAVTVIADRAIEADGLDNALMGMGVKKALAFMAKRKEQAFFIYRDEKGNIKDTATAGFHKLVIR